MKRERLDHLLLRFKRNAPAALDDIEAFEKETSIALSPEYREFLQVSDGGEGIVGTASYAMLWRVNELLRFNKEYEVAEYAPGLLFFGSNGGGEGFAFDLRVPEKPIVAVPFIGMDLADATPVAETFDGFLEYLGWRN
jgi:SMI1 / KNR4 family (SUKH-1)